MNKLKTFIGLVIILLINWSCKKEKNPDPLVPEVKQGLVINELMAANSTTVYDQNGEYDDWIEIYNLTDSIVDISGYYLSDSKSDLSKWKFPAGTYVPADSSIVVWADSDTLQSGLHTNYKLSSAGETLLLLTPDLKLTDIVKFEEVPLVIGEPVVDQSFARKPNGTGAFEWSIPTFNKKNS